MSGVEAGVSDAEYAYTDLIRLQQEYMSHYGLITQFKDKAKVGGYTVEELADLGYLCREMASVADEFRKEALAKMELFSRLLAERMLKDLLNGGAVQDRAVGKYATATPEVKARVKLPAKDTAEYARLVAWLGIPEHNRHFVRMHYPSIRDEVTERAKRGENPPPGIVTSSQEFKCTYRKRRTNAG